jgi:hypothetical protein
MRLDDQRCFFGVIFPEKIQGTRHAAGVAARTLGAIYIQSHKELLFGFEWFPSTKISTKQTFWNLKDQ